MLTISDEEREDGLDLVFSALGNRRRRQIVLTLATRPAAIAELAQQQGVSLPAIHRHVVALEAAGLIERRKSGRDNFLAINREGLLAAQGWVGQFAAHWGTASETLDNYLASIGREAKGTES